MTNKIILTIDDFINLPDFTDEELSKIIPSIKALKSDLEIRLYMQVLSVMYARKLVFYLNSKTNN